jgi:nicotinamide mononucleotide transporter
MSLGTALWQQALQTSALEWTAVALAVAYLVLAIRENPWCWAAGFASTALYLVIFWRVGLLSESLLQIFYLAMSAYGYWRWRHDEDARSHRKPVVVWPLSRHIGWIALVAATSLLWGHWVAENTRAAWPYADALTTGFAIFATWLVAEKVLENWLYWMLIDSVSAILYASRGLVMTAVLFILYVMLCVVGWRQWKHALSTPRDK